MMSFYHFSIDDVLKSLIEVTDRKIGLFEHQLFAFLREVHDTFGTNMDLYLFERQVIEGVQRSLTEVKLGLCAGPDAAWLRFGPHARDFGTPPHTQTPEDQRVTFATIYREIDRIAGAGRRSRWVRLHYFSEPYEAAPFLTQAGVEALLLTDKDKVAYRLPEPEKAQLREKGAIDYAGIALRRSHVRVENLLSGNTEPLLDTLLKKHGYLALFTHEYELSRPEVRERMRDCIAHLAATLPSF